jgi:glucuronate isomerase
MSFITEDFLLHTPTAKRLYHEFAADQPIIDYHNHLIPREIAENRQFQNLFEIWLAGDHYKWRAMRANGCSEKYVTGDATPREKFMAWANTVPNTVRNPLYHWTHLELKRYFGIDELLNGDSAPRIWDLTSEMLATPDLRVHSILARFKVLALCTTDDPADDLALHESIAKSGLNTRVYPAFRPDKALGVNDATAFNQWVDRLASAANVEIGTLQDFEEAIDKRHEFFHQHGARLSDHGLNHCFADFPTKAEAAAIFAKARSGHSAGEEEHNKFAAHMMLFFGKLDAKRGWTKQIHLGALRSVSKTGLRKLGPDTGFDSMGDFPQAEAVGAYMNRLEEDGALPKMILYNNNPVDNYPLATMVGNFQDGITPGKMQFGSGWWFLDTKEGIELQLNALSNVGLLSRFVGMLTDSRSMMSFPRHEYFRRVLCNLIGRDIENGEIPNDDSLVRPLIENICINNAKNYLGLELGKAQAK